MRNQAYNNKAGILFGIAVGLLTLALSSVFAEFAPEKSWQHAAWSALGNLSASLTAAVLGALLFRVWTERGVHRRRARFMRLLGIRSLDRPVGIVLPRFDLDPSTENTGAHEQPIRDGAVKDFRLSVRAQLAFDDVVAVRHISTMFGELGLTAPVLLFDREARVALFGDPPQGMDVYDAAENDAFLRSCERARECEAFIIIGLFSNCVTMQFDKTTDKEIHRRFKLTSIDLFTKGKRGMLLRADRSDEIAWCNAQADCDNTRHNIERNLATAADRRRDLPDLSLIAKCKGPGVHGKNCLIVGGAAARGTRKTSEWLAKNWEEMLDDKNVGSIGGPIDNKYFAVLFALPSGAHADLSRLDLSVEP